MSDDYTPTAADVRNHYAYGCGPEHTWDISRADFDRWLAAHDAEVIAAFVNANMEALDGSIYRVQSDGSASLEPS